MTLKYSDAINLLTNVDVPEGEAGEWRVERFEVTEEQAKRFNLGLLFGGGGNRQVKPGNYTRLMYGKAYDPVMSDTPAERRDHIPLILEAKGHVLINGLGLGMCVQACLNHPDVERVTVIEIAPDVISLVGPHYLERFGADRLEIIEHDALTYMPPKGMRYGAVWHDIWPEICADNWPTMGTLHRKYGRRTDWQGSWVRDTVYRLVRDERGYDRNRWRW